MTVNKAILVGNLGRDPEVRYLNNGDAMASFSIATSESWKDNNGERVTKVEWHNIIIYKKLAEIAGKYLTKGSTVYLEGRIQNRKYTGKDGVERVTTEIVVSEMKMMGNKTDSVQAEQTPPPPKTATRSVAPKQNAAPPIDDLDDDIPFSHGDKAISAN